MSSLLLFMSCSHTSAISYDEIEKITAERTATTTIMTTETVPEITTTETTKFTSPETDILVTTTTPTDTTTTTTKTEKQTTTTTAVTEPAVVYERKSEDNYLFIGDSRFYFWYTWGLYGTYIARSGCGADIIYENYDEITSYRDYNVVFNIGANEWWNGYGYADLLNNLPDEFTENNHIIVMSVNPTDGQFYWMNEKFDAFNEALKSSLREDYEYVDTASYMKENGFETADGLHYTTRQDYIIYDLLMYGIPD